MFFLADTHCHLDFDTFDSDRDAVIQRAQNVGVGRMLNPGIDIQSSRVALRLAREYDEVYVACGVHPNDALTWDNQSQNELLGMLKQEKVVAVGEIGLDYYRDRAPRDLQKRVLNMQLDLAEKSILPVVLHNRQATEDMMQTLTAWHANLVSSSSPLAKRPGVLHSFSGDIDTAKRAVEMNFMIGITGPVTYKNADELRQIIASIPLSSLLIETDAPFLTPHPHRGERNEPAYVRWIAERIAEIHKLSVQVVAEQTSVNSQKVFNW